MPLTPGARLGVYEILSPLGAGGMGEVYRARDSKLGRDVALKILPDAVAAEPERIARFDREARTIAALNHPHIVTIYSIEEADGLRFLTMELVEGQTLDASIIGGGMTIARFLDIAIPLTDALAAAHQKQITHRDLKPRNVMVATDGRVKVLDFGLASVGDPFAADQSLPETRAPLTHEGTIVGTMPYMSPEQVEGRPVDPRSDLFSLGVMFHEMLTAARPFRGNSSAALLSSILRDTPPPVTVQRADAPDALARLVARCLEKRPDDRVQTARDVYNELRHVQKQIESSEVRRADVAIGASIAVLPFVDMSAAKDQEWFSDGLAEEIINALVQIPNLKVIARTSAFAFKGKNEDIRQIAQVLGVAHVLEGSVRKAGNRIRVTAQLIIAADGTHLWSERYDRELEEVFALQDEIARSVATMLRVHLAPERERRRHTPTLPAYEAVLKGRHHFAKNTPESLTRAKECYEQAVALDPEFAVPHTLLGVYWFWIAFWGLRPAREAMPAARAAAQRALDLDPSSAESHSVLGVVAALYDYDWDEAERRFRLVIAGPSLVPDVRFLYAYFYLLAIGRHKEALEHFQHFFNEDPLNVWFRFGLGLCLVATRRDEEAIHEFRQILELDENYWVPHMCLGWLYASHDRFADALPYAERGWALAPWSVHAVAVLAGVLRRTGNLNRAEELLQTLGPADRYKTPLGLASFHAICGEIDQAADAVEKAIEQRDPDPPTMMTSISIFRPLRSSARWPRLAKLMKLPEMQ